MFFEDHLRIVEGGGFWLLMAVAAQHPDLFGGGKTELASADQAVEE